MTTPFITLNQAGAGLFAAAVTRPDADANAPPVGGNAAAKASSEFTAALNIALLLGHGPATALRANTPVAPSAGTTDPHSNEDGANNPSGNADGAVSASTTPVDARAGERRQPQDQDRAAINAIRSFVERIAGTGADKTHAVETTNCAAPANSAHTPTVKDTSDEKTKIEQRSATAQAAPAAVPSAVAPAHVEPVVDPSLIVRDVNALQPEMRVRVERVITRMNEEFGHEVTVAETWRSQARQNDLHEQGRTRPGAIVTWTQHSKHTDGMAADLVVDGDRGDDVAYARLQRIAGEEGLRTLGSRDPGHVELTSSRASMPFVPPKLGTPTDIAPSIAGAVERAVAPPNARTPGQETRTNSALQQLPTPPESMARIATVATVAQIAPVAMVATVASVASSESAPADESKPSLSTRTKTPTPKREAASAVPDPSPMRISAVPRDGTATPLAREVNSAPATTFTPGAETASRAERVHALQDAARSGSVSGLVLRLDSPDGTDDRVRVDLRGRQVSARIDVPDATRATDLTNKLPDLARALEARGFQSSELQVHAALAPSVDDKAFALAGASADSRSTRSTPDIITRGDSRPAQDDGAPPRSHQHHHNRNRPRREREGDTQ